MAVPPIQAAGLASLGRVNRLPLVLDVIVGLLTALAVPLAIVAIPNTISVVSALLPPEIAGVGILRAHGLALPVMLCAVPLAAAALRRSPPAPILVAGLALLALADVAGGFAGSTLAVGALRVLHGVGAGLLIPATFAAAWERPGTARGVLVPIWAGALAAGLLGAQALALWPLDEVTSWRVTLQPYPLLTGVALALAAAYFMLSRAARDGVVARRPEAFPAGRRQLVLAGGSAAGVAVLAFGTTFNWPSGLIVAAASVAVLVLLVMAAVARAEGPGARVLAFVMVAVGLVVLPTAAQVTYVELGGLGGPGLSGMWIPFVLAGVIAVAAALMAARAGGALVPRLVVGGLVTMVVGLCAVRLFVPEASGTPLIVPFTLLTAGAAVAVTSALRGTSLNAALFGVSLGFPAVLSGFLLGTGIQVGRLRAVSTSGKVTSQAMVDGFVGALHIWALVAGFAVVIVLALGAVLARRVPEPALAGTDALGTARSARHGTPGFAAAWEDPPEARDPYSVDGARHDPVGEMYGVRHDPVGEEDSYPPGRGRTYRAGGTEPISAGGGERHPGDDRPYAEGPDTSIIPVVPPPTQSPEATPGPNGPGPTTR
ncbi:hypothetical protein [Sphaerisporangium corydalis]|uniref:MFS transporter n=1 Tax=Sphaerisporangium corydalis TaxID=1441875 RepID=A0ABV9EL52_9ACTN|nr:hypothetical protein [Sphaerisporangium corydalis]